MTVGVVDADYLDGACWDIADGTNRDTALDVPDFPLALVSWWASQPGDAGWCYCRACPRVPTEAPDGADFDHCDGHRIAHYAARIAAADDFPPIQVIHDPTGQEWGDEHFTWLVDDGMHRISAYLLLGRTTIPAFVYTADPAAALTELTAPWRSDDRAPPVPGRPDLRRRVAPVLRG